MHQVITEAAIPFTCDETCADCGRSVTVGDKVFFYRFFYKSLLICDDCLPLRAGGLMADLMAATTPTKGQSITRETFTLDVKKQGAFALSRAGYRRLGEVYDFFADAHDDEIIISSIGPVYKQWWRAFLKAHEATLRPDRPWKGGYRV